MQRHFNKHLNKRMGIERGHLDAKEIIFVRILFTVYIKSFGINKRIMSIVLMRKTTARHRFCSLSQAALRHHWMKNHEYHLHVSHCEAYVYSPGKALCLLARSDFMERLPNNGDVLYNCLQNLISKNIGMSNMHLIV